MIFLFLLLNKYIERLTIAEIIIENNANNSTSMSRREKELNLASNDGMREKGDAEICAVTLCNYPC